MTDSAAQPKRALLGVIVLLFVILAVGYSLITPVFETPDELFHYPVIAHIADTGRLPVQHPGDETLWMQEGTQPPLYYMMGAALTFWVDDGDLETVRTINPHARIGAPGEVDNLNYTVHTAGENFPWQGTTLAVHLVRFLSVVMGAASLVLAHRMFMTVWPDRPHVVMLATALMAFNPMFIFISGSVNNDNLMILTGTWILLLLVRILRDGLTPLRMVALGVAAALATLAKISGLTFVPVVGLALLLYGWRTREWKKMIWAGVALAGFWLALAGWWYWRNIQLYGELTGLQTHLASFGTREITLLALSEEWYGLWASYWAVFGWFNILADRFVYIIYGALSIVGLAGALWWVISTLRRRAWEDLLMPGVLAVQGLVTLAGLVRWSMMTTGSQGRLLFPVISVFSGFMALGLLAWLPEKGRLWARWGLSAMVLALAIASPFLYIQPAYARPDVIEAAPPDMTPVEIQYGGFEIVGLSVEPVAVEAGDFVPVTVYIRAIEPLDDLVSLYVHLLGREQAVIGKLDSYPGRGNLPATEMEPGTLYADTYFVRLDEDLAAPATLRMRVGVGLADGETYTILPGQRSSGEAIDSVTVEVGAAYPAQEEACVPAADDVSLLADVGGFARLSAGAFESSYRAGDAVPVTLVWEPMGGTDVSWTVFVHLIDGAGQPVTQADGPPLAGDYSTQYWRAGCPLEDVHTLTLPEDLALGAYTVVVGMYNAADPAFGRAPVTAADGAPFVNQAVPVGTVQVVAP